MSDLSKCSFNVKLVGKISITMFLFCAIVSIAGAEPKDLTRPVDLLVVIDSQNAEQFSTAIATAQNFAVIPGSKISVISTSEHQPLIVRENIALDDQLYRMELSKFIYKRHLDSELTLAKLKTITQGHFTNDNRSHRKAQILCILTGHKHITRDAAFIQDIRRVKIFVIALGFSSEQFSHQFVDLAADKNHIMARKNPQDLNIDNWKQQISTDSQFPCDTDRYNRRTMENCYSSCKEICRTTRLVFKMCQEKCPYYKEIDTTKYMKSEDTKPASFMWVIPTSFGSVGLIGIAVVTYTWRDQIRRFGGRIRKGIGKQCNNTGNKPNDENTEREDVVIEENVPLTGQRDTEAQQEVGDEGDSDEQIDSNKVKHIAEALQRDDIVFGGEMVKLN